jgi:6-pyruvoyltetrahydropterin/6-carboxytetrahydropterin synthase
MVCDYKALKVLVGEIVHRVDHTMAVSSVDPELDSLRAIGGDRVLEFEGQDPTTEVVARWLYGEIAAQLAAGRAVETPSGTTYRLPEGLELERVRVWETSSSWAEYVGLE